MSFHRTKRRGQFAAGWLLGVPVGLMAAALIVFAAAAMQQQGTPAPESPPDSPADRAAVAQAKNMSRAFRSAARKVLPTVVKIRTSTRAEGGENPFRGTPFEGLFNDRQRLIPGLGSGVIIDPKGVVLTNRHVIEDSEEIIVQLADGRQFKATEVRSDKQTDLAVVLIDPPEPLPAARLGDSSLLEIGDWVIAIGHPFELEQTVSAGIISAKGRSLGAVERARLLQTDAAINPGNSGGPLVNLDGEVVAISTAIFSRTGGNEGIGFAIPINLAKWVVPQLLERGSVARAYLGVQMVDIGPDDAQELGLEPKKGVIVERVFADSPAEAAGLQRNDVIVSYDDRPIRGAADLQEAVERSAADSQHRLGIIRNGKSKTLKVVVKPMPENFGSVASGTPKFRQFFQDRRLGLMAVEIPPGVGGELGQDGTAVVIVHVNRGSPADKAGLRQGAVIRSVAGQPVKNLDQFKQLIEKQDLDQGITLEVETREGKRKVTLKSNAPKP